MNPNPQYRYPHPVPRLVPAVVSIIMIAGIFITLIAGALGAIDLVNWAG